MSHPGDEGTDDRHFFRHLKGVCETSEKNVECGPSEPLEAGASWREAAASSPAGRVL